MGVAIDAAEEYSPGPPEGSVRPMSTRLRLVRLLDRASHRLELADARAACRREGHWWDSERPAGALHVHDFCWRCEARR